MKNRDVDLVIESDQDMKMFLKYLIFSLKTIDGNRGTGQKLFDTLLQQEKFKYLAEKSKPKTNQNESNQIISRCET